MAVLWVERGRDRGRQVPLRVGKPVVVGRELRCELALRDAMASRRHLVVEMLPDGRIAVKDLRSSNGSFLNGQRLPPDQASLLTLEDKLEVGSTLLTVVNEETAASAGQKDELTGRGVGNYLVEARIGRGSMGTVYRALQVSLERTVALKVIARDLSRDHERVKLFLDEARAAGKLKHPHIVQVYDVGIAGGLHFYSMELMERGSLEEQLEKEGKLEVPRALLVGLHAAKGLAYAEQQGIVHRDVKPANLLVNGEGVTKIGDLGIARAASVKAETASGPSVGRVAGAGATEAAPPPDVATPEGTAALEGSEDEAGPEGEPARGSGGAKAADLLPEERIWGSPLYLAPEQAEAGPVDHRADLYALGATLFHALLGEPPFTGGSPREVIQKHRGEPARRLDAADPGIPADVADVVARLLEKRPEDRLARAADLVERLEELVRRYPEGWTKGAPPAVTSASQAALDAVPEASGAPILGVPRVYLAAAAGVLALLVAGGGVAWKVAADAREAKRQEDEARRLADEARERDRKAAEARALAEREREKRRREEAGEAALAEALRWQLENASDLDGARGRFEEVARAHEGTAAAEKAKRAVQAVDESRASLERVMAERREKEAAALAAAEEVLEAAASGPLRSADVVRKRLDDLSKRFPSTDVAEKRVPQAREKLAARVAEVRKGADGVIAGALKALDFARARAEAERVAALDVPDLRGWVEQKRAAIASAERAARASAEAALEQKKAREVEAVDAKDDLERRRRLDAAGIVRDLEALKKTLVTDAGRAHAEERITLRSLEERYKQRFLLHVRKGEKPPIPFPVAKGIEGAVSAADDGGVVVQARSGGGNIEIERTYVSLTPEDAAKLFGALPALSPDERAGLVSVLLAFGERERAKKELERALRDAERDGDAPRRALLERLQAECASAPAAPEKGAGKP